MFYKVSKALKAVCFSIVLLNLYLQRTKRQLNWIESRRVQRQLYKFNTYYIAYLSQLVVAIDRGVIYNQDYASLELQNNNEFDLILEFLYGNRALENQRVSQISISCYRRQDRLSLRSLRTTLVSIQCIYSRKAVLPLSSSLITYTLVYTAYPVGQYRAYLVLIVCTEYRILLYGYSLYCLPQELPLSYNLANSLLANNYIELVVQELLNLRAVRSRSIAQVVQDKVLLFSIKLLYRTLLYECQIGLIEKVDIQSKLVYCPPANTRLRSYYIVAQSLGLEVFNLVNLIERNLLRILCLFRRLCPLQPQNYTNSNSKGISEALRVQYRIYISVCRRLQLYKSEYPAYYANSDNSILLVLEYGVPEYNVIAIGIIRRVLATVQVVGRYMSRYIQRKRIDLGRNTKDSSRIEVYALRA